MTDTADSTPGLVDDEAELFGQVANTSRAYRGGIPSGWPATVTTEFALRIAEKSYRRGFNQGADAMRENISGDPPADPGQQYAEAIAEWRARGAAEGYTRGDLPPGP